MRTAPLGPSVELPMEPRNAALGGRTACELRHGCLRWSSLWGHEALPWVWDCLLYTSDAADDTPC
eukprot:5807199-Pyramimonas_sp.AAC.1